MRRAARLLALLAASASAFYTISPAVARLRTEKCPNVTRAPPGSYVVFTAARSGSRWFVNTLTARSGGRLSSFVREAGLKPDSVGAQNFVEENPRNKACYGVASKQCSCALREAFWNEQRKAGRRRDRRRAPGWKYMMAYDYDFGAPAEGAPPPINAFVASVCDLRVPFVILHRRNILRRLISKASDHLARVASGVPENANNHGATAHAVTERGAAALRRARPALDAATLAAEIRAEASSQTAIVGLLGAHCGGEWDVPSRVFYYEDLVDANRASPARWGEALLALGASDTSDAEVIRARLGGWPTGGGGRKDKTEGQAIIHASVPVLETVANPRDVERALRGTAYEWMLDN